MKDFQKFRPRDTNLEIAISEKEQNLTYYMFNEPALNGFSKSISERHQNERYQIGLQLGLDTHGAAATAWATTATTPSSTWH